ncbi:hypothetical protein OAK45_03005 [Verrucomicrobia bacterium]|nr:hypothetical protein [Verrucomicrobiota bacterium]
MHDKESAEIEIYSRDYYFKVVEFLQQNWALIDEHGSKVTVWFIHDASGIFDQLDFASVEEAKSGLERNGFRRLSEDPESQKFIYPPEPPFLKECHGNGPIYSSGRFWK